MVIRGSILVTVLALLFMGAAISAQEYGEISDGDWTIGPPPGFPEANAVVVFDRGYQVAGLQRDGVYPRMEFRRHVRMKALTRAGADEIGNAEFSYYSSYGLEDVRAHTVCPDGSVYEVPEEGYHVKRVGKWRTRTFAFPHVDSGCIVEYTFKVYADSWVGFDSWYFHHPIYSLESTYNLEMERGFGYVFQTRNMPPESRQPIATETAGLGKLKGQCYTWRLRNLPPIKAEPYMTCIEEYMSSIQVRFTKLRTQFYAYDAADSWPQLAMQFEPAIEEFLDKPRDFRVDIKRITRGCETKYEQSKALYRYVVDNIETRQDGYYLERQHDKLTGVWKEKYGTAMEKNLLLLKMLRESGIKAWPILICTRDHAHFDPAWLDLGQFTHVIVFAEVEQGGIYLDATSKYNAYGTLPPVCRTQTGLMLDGDKSDLVRIATNDPSSYRIDFVTFKLDETGQAACSTTAVFTGYLAADYGRRFETDEVEDFIDDDILAVSAAGYRRGDYEATVDSLNAFRVQTDYTIEDAARRLENNLALNTPCGLFSENPFKSDRRFFPIDFNYGFTYQNIVRVEIPEGADVATLPVDTAFALDGITYERFSYKIDRGVQIESKVSVARPFFEVEEYNRVREFFDRVTHAATPQVVFTLPEQQ